ncbi:MAG: Gfo/Idh/MocA family oxidoreductase [Clostridia bacterium]|nr:Gfo/Idh/MocA family oxidoreductase [Clostridia bacterium]
MNKILTVSILGCGSRGFHAYGMLINQLKDKFKIVSLCDCNEEELGIVARTFGISQENCFTSDTEFFKQKRSDVLIIATLDKQHYEHALKALNLGYDILLEKPITDNAQECLDLMEAQRKNNNKVVVCHVLRYAKAFVKAKQLLEEGRIGLLVNIQALEQVAYWHVAHSYVRGNWRRSETTTPMILAKCCHDLDLLQYYAQSKAKNVSSVGACTYFTKENAPKDAAARCVDCPHKESCTYSAKRIYIDRFIAEGKPENIWPYNVIAKDFPVTVEKLEREIYGKDSLYGRCVFACDNNVVSHQTTNVLFENGVTASLTMMGFTHVGGRIYRFFGTLGEIVLDEANEIIEVKTFGGDVETIRMGDLTEAGMAHGGGDAQLIEKLYNMIMGTADTQTSLENSLESHLMGIAAENSRRQDGKTVQVHG